MALRLTTGTLSNNKQILGRHFAQVEVCEGVVSDIYAIAGDARMASVFLLDVMQRGERIERREHIWWERGDAVAVENAGLETSWQREH